MDKVWHDASPYIDGRLRSEDVRAKAETSRFRTGGVAGRLADSVAGVQYVMISRMILKDRKMPQCVPNLHCCHTSDLLGWQM